MSMFLKVYTVVWACACLVAVILYLKDRGSFPLSHQTYWRSVFTPWKVVTFLIAVAGLIILASTVRDPELDYFDAVFMAVLTYLTAPWVVGVFYRFAKGTAPAAQAFVALCLWLFCASWFFDSYILLKDGHYPLLWPTYMLGTLGLYVLGGLFWNLDWRLQRGTIFAFMEAQWPVPPQQPVFSKIFGVALIFMVTVSGCFIWFFREALLSILS
jgi:hypothetical protein